MITIYEVDTSTSYFKGNTASIIIKLENVGVTSHILLESLVAFVWCFVEIRIE